MVLPTIGSDAFPRTRRFDARDRLALVHNAKRRTTGVDVAALDTQIAEKKVLQAQELERERAHDVLASTLDRRLVMLEQERREIQRDMNANIAQYRAEHQQKSTRREFDLSDPSGGRDSRPARLGDDDPRTGPSGAQKFAGEDLFAGERRLAQTKQAAAWYAAQAAEKEMRRQEARAQKKQHGDLIAAQEEYQRHVAEAQADARKAHANATAEENARLADERRSLLQAQKASEKAADDYEFEHNENSAFLTENPVAAVSTLAPGRRVRPDHWKGASAEELQATAIAQAEQRRLKIIADAAFAEEERQAASHYENTRRALEMNAERVEQFKAEQRAAVLAMVIGQRAEKFENDQSDRAERFGSGRFGEAYFQGFGTSASTCTMPALLTSAPSTIRVRGPIASPNRSARRAGVRVYAGAKADVQSQSVGRRGAALGLGAALVAGFVGGEANAVECNMVTPCMPGTEPGAPPRYQMPGPAYSPAEAAEERFRLKIQAERAAEKSAYETQYKREQAAADAAAAAAVAAAAP